jgi:hypothetical protein
MSKIDNLILDSVNILSHSLSIFIIKGIKEAEVP